MNDFRFFDAHSHLNDVKFADDLGEVLAQMKTKNVGTIVVGTDLEMSRKAIEIAAENDGIYACIGMHPTDNLGETYDEKTYREFVASPKVVAIGECGLDYSRVLPEDLATDPKRQKELFEKHIELAAAFNKPLMIHCRDAHKDVLEILSARKRDLGDKLRGNIHFFSEGAETAKKYFDLDFTISFTGVITFARNYDEAIRYAPLDRILSETDCPYVAPIPYRGKRNEPNYVEEVVKKLAEIRGEDFETVREATVMNALRFLQG